MAQLVARTAGGREVASSSLVIPTIKAILTFTVSLDRLQYKEAVYRAIACIYVRGKSGQYRIRQPLTAAGGDPRESATETIPPVFR